MLVGVDIGGTFTDLAWWTGSNLVLYKAPTTPDDPVAALLDALNHVGANQPHVLLAHGSTIATNALLERKGARVVFLGTEGFVDLIEIARQNRVGIYDARAARVTPLVPPEDRVGVRERLAADGSALIPLTQEAIEETRRRVEALRPEAIAICLLHTYANDAHERALAQALTALCPYIFQSAVVDPAYREYERASTTVLNAYVAPLVARYVASLRERARTPLRLMGSDGGLQSGAELGRPASMILSGPAGGVVGAHHIARVAGFERIITLDMGGTSTDVALLPGRPLLTRESQVEGFPLRAPMLDILTIGAGGGSIARLDRGGALVVGPESAGARPGPACYGRGGEDFTVTDAHVLLDHILPERFLGGELRLDAEASRRAAERAIPASMKSVEAFAAGVLQVANAAMERAIRRVSSRRGYDPADFTLFCFGGAGGLHAVELARAVGMRGVLIPRAAGVLSALGMALADTLASRQRSVLEALTALTDDEIERRLRSLAEEATRELEGAGPHPLNSLTELERPHPLTELERPHPLAPSPTGEGEPRPDGRDAEPASSLPTGAEGRGSAGVRSSSAGTHNASEIVIERTMDLRYRGQSYELPIGWTGAVATTIEAFHREHEQRFGYADLSASVEAVTMRVFARALNPGFPLPSALEGPPAAAIAEVNAWFEGEPLPTLVYQMESLTAGQEISGPAILAADYATTLLPAGTRATIDHYGNAHVRLRMDEKEGGQ